MATDPVYFLIKYYPTHYTCYARGISVLDIHELHMFSIIRMYPSPSKDLTPAFVQLQRRWKQRRAYRRWASHPFRLFYREQNGRFPPYLKSN